LSEWSSVREFITGAGYPLTAPILLSPVDSSIASIEGDLSWQSIPRAKKYKLQLSLNPFFKTLLLDSTINSLTNFHYNNLSGRKTYYWRVKAFSIFDSSSWTKTSLFNTPEIINVKLISPGNDMHQVPLDGIVIWNKKNGAEKYHLQLSSDSSFNNNLIDDSNILDSTYKYTALKQNTRYYWRVCFFKDGKQSLWSIVFSFITFSTAQLREPKILTPKNTFLGFGTIDTLKWESVSGADSYMISVSKDIDFVEDVIKKINIKDTHCIIDNLENNQMYYWRVSAKNINTESQWSEVFRFVTEFQTPSNISPVNLSAEIPTSGFITWDDVPGCNTYLLLLSESKNFENKSDSILVQNSSSFKYSLNNETTYFLKLRAGSGNFNVSKFSELITFTTSKTIDVGDNNNYNQDISIYPNPVMNDQIRISNNSLINIKFNIYNQYGKLEFSGISSNNDINVEKLSVGVYYIAMLGNIYKFVKLN
jgi:hypothetical protein